MKYLKRFIEQVSEPEAEDKLSIKEKQQRKAKQVINYLIENLPKDKYSFISYKPTTSETKFGTSTYFSVENKDLEGYKFRISDHSVTNQDRMFGEIHYDEDTYPKELLDILLKRISNDKKDVEIQNKKFDKTVEITKKLKSFWEEIKQKYEGLGFHRMDRTFQDLETFLSKKDYTKNIYQEKLDNNAFRYEWTEPLNINPNGKKKPSLKYIENYLIPKHKGS